MNQKLSINNTLVNNTLVNNTLVNNSYPIYSLQYLIVCGYVILSWGTYNFVSIISKCMLIYIIYYG